MITDGDPTAAVVIFLLGVAGIVLWAILRWRKIGPELFPDSVQPDESPGVAQPVVGVQIHCASRLIERAAALLEEDDSPLARLGVDALRKFELSDEIAPAIDALMMKSRESASLESLMVRKDGSYAYVVAVPSRHEHAHLLRRYAPFAAGWRHHLELVRASLTANGTFMNMVAMLLFLNPEKKESVLQISCCDQGSVLIPSPLAERSDLNQAGLAVLDSSIEFNLTG